MCLFRKLHEKLKIIAIDNRRFLAAALAACSSSQYHVVVLVLVVLVLVVVPELLSKFEFFGFPIAP